jgi:DNA-directed RNA polymerase subunit RPC12/RpoP
MTNNYLCKDCKKEFEKPKVKITENQQMTYTVCPFCESTQIQDRYFTAGLTPPDDTKIDLGFSYGHSKYYGNKK